ncbi:MAG: GxxExxY protein [Bacteroidota bacterium]
MAPEIRIDDFPLKDETDFIIGRAYEIHRLLGFGFAEIVYKDAFEIEFVDNDTLYKREKEYTVSYKGRILKHKFFSDFVVFDNVILEVKAKSAIAEEDYAQTINYLKCSGCKVGLILNFGRNKLEIKRVVF